jgi:hypothetical protein
VANKLVPCPRTECEKGYETYDDPTGVKITVLCYWCKGVGKVGKERMKVYLIRSGQNG